MMKYLLITLFCLLLPKTAFGKFETSAPLDSAQQLYFKAYSLIIKDVEQRCVLPSHNIEIFYAYLSAASCGTKKNYFRGYNEPIMFNFWQNKDLFGEYLLPKYTKARMAFLGDISYDIIGGRVCSMFKIDKGKKKDLKVGLGNIIKRSKQDYYILVFVSKGINSDNELVEKVAYFQHLSINTKGKIKLKERQKVTIYSMCEHA